MRARNIILGCLALCAAAPAVALSEAEQRVRIQYDADQVVRTIAGMDLLYGDAALDGYLQEVVDRLYPDYRGKLEVHAFKQTSFNAFSMPNGRLYVNIGALLRLTNEAELAALLGHEGAHFTKDHIY